MRIEPFQIRVPDDTLADLRVRLGRTRWPAPSPDGPWEGGTDHECLRALVGYWAEGFDWRAQEARLNRIPQFLAEVDGARIHFLHVRGAGPRPLPLVITHGWPGSVVEMLRLIPLLADPASHGGDPADAFDVVVPSLPGYGFSTVPQGTGVDPVQIAGRWERLMVDGLGYRRFGAQGGDWGASVATRLALTAPERVIGLHLNYLPGSYRPWTGEGVRPLSASETEFLDRCAQWGEAEGAYAHLQRTKPETAAFGLTDSPTGLAAWIVEKLHGWSDGEGNVEQRLGRDDILTNIMLYWITGTIGSSMRLYRHASRVPLRFGPADRVRVPTGMAVFPGESPACPPREWVERGYKVTRWTPMPRGGHFAAWEEPGLLADDVRAFFRPLR